MLILSRRNNKLCKFRSNKLNDFLSKRGGEGTRWILKL